MKGLSKYLSRVGEAFAYILTIVQSFKPGLQQCENERMFTLDQIHSNLHSNVFLQMKILSKVMGAPSLCFQFKIKMGQN